jgi:hypothetical protein
MEEVRVMETKLGTVRTDTYGVTIKHNYYNDDLRADIICDLEDEIVDKAVMRYHRKAHFDNFTDEMTDVWYVVENKTDSDGNYHAYTNGVRARDRIAEVIVTVFRTTMRM